MANEIDLDNFDVQHIDDLHRQADLREREEDRLIAQQAEALRQAREEAAAQAQRDEARAAQTAAEPGAEQQPDAPQPQEDPTDVELDVELEGDDTFLNQLADVGGGILGGLRDAGVNIAQTGIDVGGLFDSGIDLDALAPDIETKTGAGQFVRTTAQFLTGFVPALGALRVVGGIGRVSKGLEFARKYRFGRALSGEVARDTAAGALADFSVFDPHEARFADLLADFGATGAVVEYLKADPEDSEAEGRLKNVLEGAGLGLLLSGALKAFKGVQKVRKASRDATEANDLVPAEVQVVHEGVIAARQSLDDVRQVRSQTAKAIEARGDPGVESARGVRTFEPDEVPDHGLVPAIRLADGEVHAGGRGHADVNDTLLDRPDELFEPREGVEPDGFFDTRTNEFLDRESAALRRQERTGDPADPNRPDLDSTGATQQGKNPEVRMVRASDDGEALREGAELRGQDFEESVADLDQAAREDNFLPQLDQRNPELAAKVRSMSGDIDAQLDDLEQQYRAELEEAEDALHDLRANNPAYREGLDAGQRAEFERAVDDVQPASIREELEAAAERNGDPRPIETGPEPPAAPTVREIDGEQHIDMEAVRAQAKIVDEAAAKKQRTSFLPDFNAPEGRAIRDALTVALTRNDPEEVGRIIGQHNLNLNRILADDDFKQMAAEIATLMREGVAGVARKQAKPIPLDKQLEPATRLAENEAAQLGLPGGGDAVLSRYTEWFGGLEGLTENINSIRILEVSLEESASHLGQMIRAGGGNVTSNTYVMFQQRIQQLGAIADMRSGVASIIGRALGTFRNVVGPAASLRKIDEELLDVVIDSAGGRDKIAILAEQWSGAHKQGRAARRKALESMRKPASLRGMFTEFWLNSILSGPITQTVNLLSNGAVGLWTPFERAVHGARTGDFAAAGRALKSYRGVITGFQAALRLNVEGAKAGLRGLGSDLAGSTAGRGRSAIDLTHEGDKVGTAFRSLILDEPQLIPNRKQFDFDRSITSENVRRRFHSTSFVQRAVGEGTLGARLIDAFGAITNIPGRLLTTGDELAKTINYHIKLTELAYEDAVVKGVDDADQHVRALLQQVPEHATSVHMDDAVRGDYQRMDELAKATAAKATFTEELTRGSTARSLQDAIIKHPTLRFVVPFVRTPVNILKFSFERMPLVRRGTQAFKEAKAAKLDGDPTLMAALNTRTTMATGLLSLVAVAAAEGKLTGSGPGQPAERAALLATGWQPNSIRVQNPDGSTKYISYNRLDPLGLMLGLAADFGDAAGHMDDRDLFEIGAGLMISVIGQLTSKSYFTGITELVDTINRPEQRVEQYLQRFAGTLVPNFFAQTRRTGIFPTDSVLPGLPADPIMREVGGVLDAIRERIPGLSQTLPPRRNVFGEVITYPMGYGPDTISPLYSRTARNGELESEMTRLIDLGMGVSMNPYKSIAGVELSPAQKDRYIELTGKDLTRNGNDLRTELTNVIRRDSYLNSHDGVDGRQAMLKDIWRRHRQRAKAKLLREDPELKAAIDVARRTRRGEILTKREQGASGQPPGRFAQFIETLTP
jgi:hypothetical protein